jgi:hypothetical protein
MTNYPRLKLPDRPLYISTGDTIDIEDENGEILLSFQSFDEYSGIEQLGGNYNDEWNDLERRMYDYRVKLREKVRAGKNGGI